MRLGLRRWEPVNIQLTEAEKGYLAGILDGEGTITFVSSRRKIVLCPKIEICSTNRDIIEWILSKVPRTRMWVGKSYSSKWKTRYSAILTHHETLLALLKCLEPYMIIKKAQARLMYLLRHVKYAKKLRIRDEKGRFIGINASKWHLEVYSKMRELNRKGKGD